MNLQTIPRKDKTIKRAFVPKLDYLVFADYPNIEMKVLAFYLDSIGYPSMKEAFHRGEDLYVTTAAGIYGIDQGAVADEQRQVGKVLNLSITYGGGMPTIMEQLNYSAPEALNVLKKFHGTWPGIGWNTKRNPAPAHTLIGMILRQVKERATADEPGYVRTLWGRHLHPKADHAALNNLCQGCAADLMKWAMVEAHRKLAGMDSHIVNMVHDELVLDVTSAELSLVCSELPEVDDLPAARGCGSNHALV